MSSWLRPIDERYGTYRGLIRLGLARLQVATGLPGARFAGDPHDVRRLVFVCLGNICRSPFAERYARSLGLPAASFGLSAATDAPADDQARKTARGFAIDLDAHRATDLSDFTFARGDLLLFMEPRHLATYRDFAPAVHATALLGLDARPARPHIHDPHRLSDAYFANCYRTLVTAVDALALRYPHLRSTASQPPA